MSTLDVLNEVAEFLEGQSDVVDGSYGEPHANRAMILLQAVEFEIEWLKARAVIPDTSKPQESE